MELWDLYSADGFLTGKTARRGRPLPPDCYHLATELWLVNSQGRILLQKRADTAHVLPGMWGMTTGCVQQGETSRAGCLRETREELGLSLREDSLVFIDRMIHGQTIWDVYAARCDRELSAFTLQSEEVVEVIWSTISDILEKIAAGELYAYPEFRQVLDWVENRFIKQREVLP